jgi:hypothetical protein
MLSVLNEVREKVIYEDTSLHGYDAVYVGGG